MKILGLMHFDGGKHTYLKPDSALLVNEKPFFLPDFSQQLAMSPCLVVRVSRLGRSIEPRFAARYYDAWTIGLNICATDVLNEAIQKGANWLEGLSFDNSLVVGEMQETAAWRSARLLCNGVEQGWLETDQLISSMEDAIAQVSRYVTIRMGDLIVVDFNGEWNSLRAEDKWQVELNEKMILSCKIK